MFAVIKLLFSHWHIILRVQKPPMNDLLTFSLMKGNLYKRTIGLRSYPGAYVNRELIVHQQLHCALYSDSYLSFLLAYYQAHCNYLGSLYNFGIFFRLNRIWVFNWLYSRVETVTKKPASFGILMQQTMFVFLNSSNFKFPFILLLSCNAKTFCDSLTLT